MGRELIVTRRRSAAEQSVVHRRSPRRFRRSGAPPC